LRSISSFLASRSPFFIFFRHSLSCSIVNGDKNVFKTHLKSFLDTSYVWGKFSVLFLFYFFAFLAIIVLWFSGKELFMTRDLEYKITAQDNGVTISEYLKKQGFSHAVIVQLKKIPESILLNGKWEYMGTRLNDGDCLFIHFEETDGSENIVATNLPLSICYEDEDILVVNKPADMPIHPSMNNYDNTLANAVCHYYQTQGIPYTFRCVNRLDRDTTGLTILAKHLISSAILNSEVSVRGISREYLAIVKGFTEDEGTVNAPIGRKEGSTIERQIDVLHGETAITHYKRLAYQDGLSLISLKLETGRTHQIRVHMKSIGHPLIGDFLYNPDFTKINRQALHSYRLRFTHPVTKKPLVFTAPLPEDMQALFPEMIL
jgi:23S rRNA pseudouridine1911/1915/1917 synthase